MARKPSPEPDLDLIAERRRQIERRDEEETARRDRELEAWADAHRLADLADQPTGAPNAD